MGFKPRNRCGLGLLFKDDSPELLRGNVKDALHCFDCNEGADEATPKAQDSTLNESTDSVFDVAYDFRSKIASPMTG